MPKSYTYVYMSAHMYIFFHLSKNDLQNILKLSLKFTLILIFYHNHHDCHHHHLHLNIKIPT